MMNGEFDSSFLSYACEVLAETKTGLSGPEIVHYCNEYAIDFDISIPITESNFGRFGNKVPNKRTALLKNLKAFSPTQQFQIIKELCELPKLKENPDVKNLKEKLYAKYHFLSPEKISDTELVRETRQWLAKYSKASELYDSALNKYEQGIYERNTLDDMRLSFELLIKDLLENNKSLENQINNLGEQLKYHNASEELRNMVIKIIDYYMKFQNNHIKHNDSVNVDEIEYVIELTSVMMKYLIKVLGRE